MNAKVTLKRKPVETIIDDKELEGLDEEGIKLYKEDLELKNSYYVFEMEIILKNYHLQFKKDFQVKKEDIETFGYIKDFVTREVGSYRNLPILHLTDGFLLKKTDTNDLNFDMRMQDDGTITELIVYSMSARKRIQDMIDNRRAQDIEQTKNIQEAQIVNEEVIDTPIEQPKKEFDNYDAYKDNEMDYEIEKTKEYIKNEIESENISTSLVAEEIIDAMQDLKDNSDYKDPE